MENIPFYKMSGSGNDFIIIDNRNQCLPDVPLIDFIQKVCARKLSAGADGLILIEPSEALDFQWQFYNSDGSRAEMCGNGARCAARFAYLNSITGPEMVFDTDAGPIQAEIQETSVKIKMTEPFDYSRLVALDIDGCQIGMGAINTGVPHAVIRVDDMDAVDVVALGRKVRHHPHFAPTGTNVNFIAPEKEGALFIRTYERGVEDETLACGTGAVAGALIHALKTGTESPVEMITRSNSRLTIHFTISGESCSDVYLQGDARVVYAGQLTPDAWHY